MNVFFYDDEFRYTENELLCDRLRMFIENINIYFINRLSVFESTLKYYIADVFILDIMGPDEDVKEYDTGKRVHSADIGIEILRRIRGGYYKNQNSKTLVIMRSARRDIGTKKKCRDNGVDYFFTPGKDDGEIISILKKMANK